MSIIRVHHVDFHYDAPYKQIFSNLDFVMDTTWRAGLVGGNGMGKSTLLALINGDRSPDAGQIDKSVKTQHFPPKVAHSAPTRAVIKSAIAPFDSWLSMMDQWLEAGSEEDILKYAELQERYADHGGYEVDANIEREFYAMGMRPELLEQPFGQLSGGERTRALLTSLFVSDGTFGLIDEPTNHLDVEGREQVANYLATKSGFLLVSHDRDFLDRAIDHVVAMDDHGVEIIQGNYSAWRRQRDDVELHEQRTRDNIKREIKQLKRVAADRRDGADSREAGKYRSNYGANAPSSIDRGYVGHKAAKQMKRALAAERRIDKGTAQKESLVRYQEKERSLVIKTKDQSSRPLLQANNLRHGFNGHQLFKDVSLSLHVGDRIAVLGANGSGKSTLLRLLSGELKPDGGGLTKPGHINFTTSTQHPRWHAGVLAEHLELEGIDAAKFRQILGSFGVKGNVFEQPLESFSQGQLKKIDLARSMVSPADFMIWDEPMNYIDVFSREQIEQAITQSLPTMIFVDHDARFVERVATGVIRL